MPGVLNIDLKVHDSFSHFSNPFYDPEGVSASLKNTFILPVEEKVFTFSAAHVSRAKCKNMTWLENHTKSKIIVFLPLLVYAHT